MGDDLHVTTRGEGRAIVVVHGWRLDSTVEQADLEPIFARHTGWCRHYVDLPGMGHSAPLGADATLETYLHALRDTAHDLVGDSPYALAGTSAGALLARCLAAIDPAVRALMLRMPLTEPHDADRDIPAGREAELGPAESVARAEKIERLWAPAERRVHPAVQQLRHDPKRYAIAVPTDPLDIPALIIAGRQDTRVGWHGAVNLAEKLPHATLAVLDGAEHEFPWGSNATFEALVVDWLTRAESVIPVVDPSS